MQEKNDQIFKRQASKRAFLFEIARKTQASLKGNLLFTLDLPFISGLIEVPFLIIDYR